MRKIIFGISVTIALLFSGCGISEGDKAKAEFKETMLSIKPENFFKEALEKKEAYEKEYGMKANVWFEELKTTNEWKALGNKAQELRIGVSRKY